jgi:hypothetical protein
VRALAGLNLAVRFVVAELGALVAVAVWAFDTFDGVAAVLVAAAAVLAVIAVWAAFVAPKAARRLSDPARIVVELVVFAAATAALLGADHMAAAIVYAALAVASASLVRVWPEPVR